MTNKDNIEAPFVTVEYSLGSRKILQCYGDNDSKPNESVMTFVNKKWLPFYLSGLWSLTCFSKTISTTNVRL